ncbi:MAG TPA: STAS domain-containing protein, partial [Casimicrobiaceae bacterium]|nr:STAS domain-containing protein [Casimicrobiaceae bacterium]
AGAAPRNAEAPREPARADEPITGASLIEWSQPQAIEVAQANPGLCAVLENAALVFANGQAPNARALLEQGIAGDPETQQSPLAWLALFDLLQRAGDRVAFDQLALQYSMHFERSAPGWEERRNAGTQAAKAATGGYIAVTGRLTAESTPQLEGLRRAIGKKLPHARLDLGGVTGYDDEGAALLAAALSEARRARLVLAIERADKLRAALDASVKAGREGGQGAWQLSLELLQWHHDQATFDDRAIEFAIAFELSPPSWEPPPRSPAPVGSAAGKPAETAPVGALGLEAVAYRGTLVGSAAPQVAQLFEFAHGRQVVAVDMTEVDRIDFVCAGALLNAVNRVESGRKSVQIYGASPIVRALLLLIGLSPRHFVRKSG